ncbi:MAG: hypothetical protein JWM68_3762 [Verrucomicrobiales bacterium]|nr:hypothetical protein [Verrucomicrobiales bacterium]
MQKLRAFALRKKKFVFAEVASAFPVAKTELLRSNLYYLVRKGYLNSSSLGKTGKKEMAVYTITEKIHTK